MAHPRSILTLTLSLYLMLIPFLTAPATAQPKGRQQGTSFEARGLPLTLDAFNGFKAETLGGAFHHDGHVHRGGLAKLSSPWGEEMQIRYWSSPSGSVAIEYGGELTVRYHLDDSGRLAELTAETADRQARTVVAGRAEQVLLGQRQLSSFDMSVYELVDDVFRGRHSEDFLAGLASFEAPASASCATSTIQCGVCIIAWAASVAAIGAGCLVGGVPTWGASCFAAILAHEATSIGCATTCYQAWEECNYPKTPKPEDLVDDGCSGPGDAV